MMSSFITVYIFTSCQLVVVVLLAIFCSQSSIQFRVERSQFFIALILCTGAIIYNLYDNTQIRGENKPLNWLSGTLLFSFLIVSSLKA